MSAFASCRTALGLALTPLALTAAIALLGAAGDARANGLSTPVIGSGFSSSTTADPAALFWNPAMLADVRDSELMLSGYFVWLQLDYQRDRRAQYQHEDGFVFAEPLAESDLDVSKTGKDRSVSAGQPLGTGGAFYALPLPHDVTLGLGMYVPYGAILSLDAGGPQRWALKDVMLLTGNLSAGAAWRVNDWFSFGASASLVIGYMGISKIADLAGTSLMADALGQPPIDQANDFGADAPASVRELAVMSRDFAIPDSYAISGTFNVGVAFNPADAWTLALSYDHGAPLSFKGDFDLDMNDPFFTTDLASQGLQYPAIVRGDAWIEFPLPPVLRFGARFEPENDPYALWFQLDTSFYSVVDAFEVTLRSEDLRQPALGLPDTAKLDLPRQWRDAVAIELGGLYQMSEEMQIGAKLGYHSPISPDSTVDVGSPDGHRLRAGVLGSIAVNDTLTLIGEADLQWVPPRKVAASDYDLANGTYELFLISVGGALRISL